MGMDVTGLVHTAVVTPANVHDSAVIEACLHGEEEEIHDDKAQVVRTARLRRTATHGRYPANGHQAVN